MSITRGSNRRKTLPTNKNSSICYKNSDEDQLVQYILKNGRKGGLETAPFLFRNVVERKYGKIVIDPSKVLEVCYPFDFDTLLKRLAVRWPIYFVSYGDPEDVNVNFIQSFFKDVCPRKDEFGYFNPIKTKNGIDTYYALQKEFPKDISSNNHESVMKTIYRKRPHPIVPRAFTGEIIKPSRFKRKVASKVPPSSPSVPSEPSRSRVSSRSSKAPPTERVSPSHLTLNDLFPQRSNVPRNPASKPAKLDLKDLFIAKPVVKAQEKKKKTSKRWQKNTPDHYVRNNTFMITDVMMLNHKPKTPKVIVPGKFMQVELVFDEKQKDNQKSKPRESVENNQKKSRKGRLNGRLLKETQKELEDVEMMEVDDEEETKIPHEEPIPAFARFFYPAFHSELYNVLVRRFCSDAGVGSAVFSADTASQLLNAFLLSSYQQIFDNQLDDLFKKHLQIIGLKTPGWTERHISFPMDNFRALKKKWRNKKKAREEQVASGNN